MVHQTPIKGNVLLLIETLNVHEHSTIEKKGSEMNFISNST